MKRLTEVPKHLGLADHQAKLASQHERFIKVRAGAAGVTTVTGYLAEANQPTEPVLD